MITVTIMLIKLLMTVISDIMLIMKMMLAIKVMIPSDKSGSDYYTQMER